MSKNEAAESAPEVEQSEDLLVSLHTTQGVKVRTLFETLTPLLVEGTILFNKDGMHIKGMNVNSFAEVSITQSNNTEIARYIYDAEEEEIIIGVSFEILHGCLSSIGPHDSCRFELTRQSMDASRPYLKLFVYNRDLNYDFYSAIYLLMIEHSEIESPMKRFSKVVSIPSSLFLKVLRFSQKRGDNLQVYTRNVVDEETKKISQYICFRTLGDDAELLFTQKFSSDGKTEVLKKELYSLKYLLLISKATNLSSTVEIYLEKDDILALKYRIGTIGSAIFAISPHMDEAEDVPMINMNGTKRGQDELPKPTISEFKRPVRRKKRLKSTKISKPGNTLFGGTSSGEPGPATERVKASSTKRKALEQPMLEFRDSTD